MVKLGGGGILTFMKEKIKLYKKRQQILNVIVRLVCYVSITQLFTQKHNY